MATALLFLIGLATYHLLFDAGFVSLDDEVYVSRNHHVLEGLSFDGVFWAFGTCRNGNWHPLVWLSFQLDAQVFGSDPFGFHFTNVMLHILCSICLCGALRLFGARAGLGVMIAVLYCIHPLHVESVAWISERKGLLASLFWFLAMIAYGWYCKKPSWGRMSFVAGAMLGGLMSKPSLVAFPIVMLAVDLWILRRIESTRIDPEGLHSADSFDDYPVLDVRQLSFREALVEKTPLVLLSICFCVIAWVTQQQAGALSEFIEESFLIRLMNVPSTMSFALLHLVWPFDLGINYLPPQSRTSVAMLSVAVLVLLGWGAWHFRRHYPLIGFGLIWFVVCFFPTSGLVPVGSQWTADRYSDLPLVGVYIALVCSAWQFCCIHQISQKWLIGVALVLSSVLGFLSFEQSKVWKNTGTLMSHATKVNPRNFVAWINLGEFRLESGDYSEAIEDFEMALVSSPGNLMATNNLGLAYYRLGDHQRAIRHFEEVIRQGQGSPEAFLNLGNCLREQNRVEAMALYRKALAMDPGYSQAHNNLGALLIGVDHRKAMTHLKEAVRLWPGNVDAQCNLANLYAMQGQWEQSADAYAKVLRLDSGHYVAKNNLGFVLQEIAKHKRSDR